MAKRPRRSTEEVTKLAQEAKKLIDGGMALEVAAKQVGIANSVYRRIILGYRYKPGKVSKKGKHTAAVIAKLVRKANALRATGMPADVAAKKVGLAKSVYWKHSKRREHGSINVASLPPRPTKRTNSHGGKRDFNPNDVVAVARRIQKLDKKIEDISAMSEERKELASHLTGLLKRGT